MDTFFQALGQALPEIQESHLRARFEKELAVALQKSDAKNAVLDLFKKYPGFMQEYLGQGQIGKNLFPAKNEVDISKALGVQGLDPSEWEVMQ